MLFNSYDFLFFFLPIALVSYLIVLRFISLRVANLWLIFSSLAFYSWHNASDLAIIIISILINYTSVRAFDLFPANKKHILSITISLNILGLIYFKYLGFISGIVNQACSVCAFQTESRELPLAISFFTFQQISFVVDQYHRRHKAVGLEKYSAAVVFFPHLIAGPLVEYKQLIPQFSKAKNWIKILPKITAGAAMFILGLSKKMLIADNLAPIANHVFSGGGIGFAPAWIGSFAYTFQLYFDFSGYSDMAVGLGLMFGIQLPENFRSPYKSRSIIEFWRRWHISLSTFLRDYLYIPLGGSRQGNAKKFRNIMLTMIIGGAWHGAGWNFFLWGFWHGGLLCMNHMWNYLGFANTKKMKFLEGCTGRIATFTAVVIGWVFFRAASIEEAVSILKMMFRPKLEGISSQLIELWRIDPVANIFIASAFVLIFCFPNSNQIFRVIKFNIYKALPGSHFASVATTILFAVLFVLCLLNMARPLTFIYYQF